MSLFDTIKDGNIPNHIAVIMDGNGRWAKKQGMARLFGHNNALTSIRETLTAASDLGSKAVTLYVFSTENWNRPKLEVDGLMTLLTKAIRKEVPEFMRKDVRVRAVGRLTDLPKKALATLNEVLEMTSSNKTFTLTLCLSYGSREEITSCIQQISEKVKNGELNSEDINEKIIQENLYTHYLPDVDLVIRTSGEQRLSNYLLWQSAYAELYFTDTLWPDFRREDLFKAVYEYQNRERRFGKTSEQLEGDHEQAN